MSGDEITMVKTCESWIPSSPNLDKVTVTFDKLNNTDIFSSIHGVYLQYLRKSQLESSNNVTWYLNMWQATSVREF